MLLVEKVIQFKVDNTYFGGGGKSANCPKLNLWLKANVVSCFVPVSILYSISFLSSAPEAGMALYPKAEGGCIA